MRYHGKTFAKAVPYQIGRHSHPKARPETPQQPPARTGIDYLNLVAADHHQAAAAAINFHALTSLPDPTDTKHPLDDDDTDQTTDRPPDQPPDQPGQVPGQLPLPGMHTPADVTDAQAGPGQERRP